MTTRTTPTAQLTYNLYKTSVGFKMKAANFIIHYNTLESQSILEIQNDNCFKCNIMYSSSIGCWSSIAYVTSRHLDILPGVDVALTFLLWSGKSHVSVIL